jgi:cytochrome bd-type quinol oxidase subunit 2
MLARWQIRHHHGLPLPVRPADDGLALVVAIVQTAAHRTGNDAYRRMTAFFGKLVTATIFLNLYPRVMVSSLGPAVAAIFTPLVLAYKGWTYWVFRKRVMSGR